ncbi:MAG TPA: hypothetical protein V6D07_07305 [Trichocoleus sp.]
MSSFSSDLLGHEYEVNIGQYFSRGWGIFKEFAWAFVVYTLALVIIGLVLGALPAPLGNDPEQGTPGALSLIYQVIFYPVLMAGYYIVAFQIARNRPKAFGDFFRSFNKFLPIFLVSLVGGLLTFLGCLAFLIPGLYLAVSYTFAQPLVIDKNIGFWQALETSRKVISKKWFSFLGLGLLLILLNIGGLIALGIGLLITAPLSFCIIAAAYEDIIGLNSVAEPTV